jgi:SAM-dependent methyltransferase
VSAANFTRRRDLFTDSGISDSDSMETALKTEAKTIGYPLVGNLKPTDLEFEAAFKRAEQRVEAYLSLPLKSLLSNAPDLLFHRGGDLALLLWLAKIQMPHVSHEVLAIYVLGFAAELYKIGRHREAHATVRFFVDVEFDWGDIYNELGISYGFFQSRDPNPFVWKGLSYLENRQIQLGKPVYEKLSILELGCGIGNDGLGFLSSPKVTRYVGTDVSLRAIEEHKKRVSGFKYANENVVHELVEGDFVTLLENLKRENVFQAQMIYSYSSLHYFNSQEVKHIFKLVSDLLTPGIGVFCFAIKGQGSIWDGQGVPIYKPDVWLNLDGQSRWFPKQTALKEMVVSYGFEVLLHERHEHWSYSEIGKPDVFHYVICTPRR